MVEEELGQEDDFCPAVQDVDPLELSDSHVHIQHSAIDIASYGGAVLVATWPGDHARRARPRARSKLQGKISRQHQQPPQWARRRARSFNEAVANRGALSPQVQPIKVVKGKEWRRRKDLCMDLLTADRGAGNVPRSNSL